MDEPEKESNTVATTKTSFRQLLVNFMNSTTSHGLGSLAAATTGLWKIFWIASCLGASGMFVFQLTRLFQIYMSRPVQTHVTINFEKELAFPAVTICNLNMIRKNEVPNELSDLFEANGTIGNIDKYANLNIPRDSRDDRDSEFDYSDHVDDETAESLREQDDYDLISEEYPDESNTTNNKKLERIVGLLMGKKSAYELYVHGHLMEDMIINCSWKGFDCNKGEHGKYWVQSWNYKYGNCYTFNNGVDQKNNPVRILKASRAGPSQSLVLLLNIQQDQYLGALTQEAGVRIAFHEQGTMAFPYEEGFSVAPGMATTVGLRKRQIKRLDRFKNGECLTDTKPSPTNIYKKFKNITRYSQQACLYSCLGKSQWNTCGCSEPAYPSKDPPCDTFNKKETECLKIVRQLYNNEKLACVSKCRRPCSEEFYVKTISSSQWPSLAYQTYLNAQPIESQYISLETSRNVVLLNIFYNELNHEITEEKFSYEATNLLADIGGQLGLWIGISVLTVCELIELTLKLLALVFSKLKTRNDVTEL